MNLYPAHAENKLGFEVLRHRLEEALLSRMGQEELETLQPAHDLDVVQAELGRVAEMQDALRFDDPVPFHDLLDVRGVVQQAVPAGATLPTEDLAAVLQVVTTIRLLHGYFTQRRAKYSQLLTLVEPLVPLPDLEKQISRVVDERGLLRDDASPELRRIRRRIVRQQQALREAVMGALRHAIGHGYATEEQPTIRNGRMVIPVRAEAKRKLKGFIHDSSATGQTVYIEPASCLDLNNEVRTLEIEEQHEIHRILRVTTDALREHVHTIQEDLILLGRLDLVQAKARLANRLEAIVPDLNTEGVVSIKQGRHPVLHLHFTQGDEVRQVVPLDLELGGGYRTLVITGPNAGGKSVAMKTVGLLALMVGYGLPVPVQVGTQMALFRQVFVDIGDEQSIENDLSTFSSHLANLRHMLERADADTLVLIDEAGTGTDPEEGGALAQAALERLTQLQARTIVTTHHGNLKAFAHETPGVENGSMAFDQSTLAPTYRFQSGIPGSSYAFEIASRLSVPKAVLARARALVGAPKTSLEDLIAAFEAKSQALDVQLVAAERTTREAKQAQTQYEEQAGKLRDEKDDIRSQALAEASQIVQQANATVERTIREIKEAQAAREATREARQKLEQFKTTVETRKQKVEKKRRRKKPKPQSKAAPVSGPLQVGDQVVLDGGTATGEVTALSRKEAEVAFGTMRTRVKLKRLTKVAGPRKQQVRVRTVQQGQPVLRGLQTKTSIDIRGQRVEAALQNVSRFLDEAVVAGLENVQILHGKGTGALRLAVQDLLQNSPDVAKFAEAHADRGGAGITEVVLR